MDIGGIMSERELYANLVDEDGVSHALRKILEGDVAAAKEGQLAFAFKDSSGKAVLPMLNDEGAIVVSQDFGTTIRRRGELLSGSQVIDSESLVVEIDLAANELYSKMSAILTGSRHSYFRIAYVDDANGTPSETTLGDAIISSGHYNFKWNLEVDVFSTVGGTGDQKLRVYATPLDKESNLYASISVNQKPQ